MSVMLIKGSIFDANTDALVNPVNCIGVMGSGVALQFKRMYPENFKAYQQACRTGDVKPGRMFVFDRGTDSRLRWIVNFPTKRHWRERSRLEDIDDGLVALAEEIGQRGICSIALPALGCGNGGLKWSQVLPLIHRNLESFSDVRVIVYEPLENR